MAPSFLYKLFISTIGRMPARYDHEVDSWWGIILTELGLLDPFREENVSHLLVEFLGVSLFALFLLALSVRRAYGSMRQERDDAREESTRGAYERCDLHNRLRNTENELYHANERLQDAENGMNNERMEFHNHIQTLDDERFVDREEIRSLKQHVSNLECDHEEYGRKLSYASRNRKLEHENRKHVQEKQELVHENQKLKSKNQQLEASLTEKDEVINDLQAQTNDIIPEPNAAFSSAPINIQLNEETDIYRSAEVMTAADGELLKKDERIRDLGQQNGTLTSEIEVLRTDLENLRNEHRDCRGVLQAQLAKKDEEMIILRAEKKTANEDSAETVAGLRARLEKKEQEVKDANGKLVASQASSADKAQRLEALRSELEASRHAHAQCDKESAGQNSRISELMTVKEQLENSIRLKEDESANLQRRITDLRNDFEELQRKHETCNERANLQASRITQLRNGNELLQGSNNNLTQELAAARRERESLMQEGQQLEQRHQTLRTYSDREILSLRGQIGNLGQTVDRQRERIHTLETNCPRCQYLRAAFDELERDIKMSDDVRRAEIRKEVREELRSQVPDDLRRQLRGEVERVLREEFQKRYSDLLTRNSKRIQEQDRQIMEFNARLEKAKNNPTICVDHAACEKKENNLMASNNKLQQDAKRLQGNCHRLKNNAQNDREQLNRAQADNDNLTRELGIMKADQRRAENINPLQSKLANCKRELEKMRMDRDKARDNCSIYSKDLSDLRKAFGALQDERLARKEMSSSDGDSLMENGHSERPRVVQSEARTACSAVDTTAIRTLQEEVARLSKELEDRKAHDSVRGQSKEARSAVRGRHLLPVNEGEQQWPEGSFPEDQPSTAPGMDRDEATALDVLSHEVDLREARDGKKAVYGTPAAQGISEGGLHQSPPQDSDDEADDEVSLPIEGAEQSDDELEEGEILDAKVAPEPTPPASEPRRSFSHRPARLPAGQSMNQPVLGQRAGKKRERDAYSDGEAYDEGWDERKKVKRHHIQAPRKDAAPAQGDKPQVNKDNDMG